MFFPSRKIITLVLCTLQLGFAVAAPTPGAGSTDLELSQRASAQDILAVLTEMKETTASIIPQIDALISTKTITPDTVRPIVEELRSVVVTTTEVLKSASPGDILSTIAGLGNGKVVAVVGGLVTDIAKIGGSLIAATGAMPGVGNGINTSVTDLVAFIDKLLPGFSALATPLLNGLNPAVVLSKLKVREGAEARDLSALGGWLESLFAA